MQTLIQRIFFGTIIFLLSYSYLLAQIEIEPALSTPLTPEALIQEVFAGKGVEIVNVSFNGKKEAVGYFKNGNLDVEMSEGFLMTTGRALLASQPNNNSGEGHTNGSMAEDPTLTSIVKNQGAKDVAVYEIEFIPKYDTLEFNYVFASEEYPEFGCNCFNDIFGFFLKGPGYADWTNLAIVPGTESDPVSVKTIHPLDPDGNINACTDGSALPNCDPVNEHLFVDNAGSVTLTYDGLTTLLTAKAVVQPCQTYSIKLAIADVGDDLYDSAVFFEANSFGSNSLQVVVETDNIDGALIEGCAGGSITFGFEEPVEEDYPIGINLIGNAIRADYTIEPASAIIPAGEKSLRLVIKAVKDEVVEPLDSIGFEIVLNECETTTYWLFIKDSDLANLELGEDQIICPGDSIALDGTLAVTLPKSSSFSHSGGNIDINTVDDNGTGPDTDASISTIQVMDVQPSILREGLIKEVCVQIAHTNVEDIDLLLESPSGNLIELSTDNGEDGNNYEMTCFAPEALSEIGFETAPFTGTFAAEGDWREIYGGATNGDWKLYVKDDTKGNDGFLINWSITFNPQYEITYNWTPDIGLSCSNCPNPKAAPQEDTEYKLQIVDSYGCLIKDSIFIESKIDTLPIVINCIEETQNSITFGWSPTTGVAYEVNVDGKGWEPASGAGAHSVRNLDQGQVVLIQVRGSGDCLNQKGVTECFTSVCFPPEANVQRILNQSCYEKEDGQIDLMTDDPNIIFIIDQDTSFNRQFTNLAAGSYSIIALDTATTCFITLDTIVERPDSIILDTFKTVANCGLDNAIAAITPSGGTLPYSILWDIGQATDTIKNLGPGTYTVQLEDDLGCKATQTITIEQNDTATSMGLPIACSDITPSSVTFSWAPISGVTLYEIKIGEEDWRSPAAVNSIRISDLEILEEVKIQVRADGGCFSILDSMSCITSDCAPPVGQFDVIFEGRCTNFTDGVIAVNSTMDNLIYILDKDTSSTGIFNDLRPGDYVITLLDTLTACSSTMEAELVNRLPLVIETFAQSENCGEQDGIAAVTVSGGVAPYDIEWSNGTFSDTIKNLATETYFATITDDIGCREERRVPINLNIDNLEDLRINVACPIVTNNSILFTWDEIPNIIDYEINVNGEGWRAAESTERHELRDLGFSEIFNLQVRGNSDCGGAVVGNRICATTTCIPPTVSFDIATGVSCAGETDGNLEIFVNTLPFSYVDTIPFVVVDSGYFNVIRFDTFKVDTLIAPIGGYVILGKDTLEATEEEPMVSFTDLFPGTYTLQLMDTTLSCRSTKDYTIEEPDTLKLSTIVEETISCPEVNDAILAVEAVGGTGPYSYDWNEGLHDSEVFTDISPGEYTVVITDINGCTTSETYIVEEPAAVIQAIYQRNNGCGETNAGAVGVKIDTSYKHSITWTTGSTADTISNLTAGNYIGIISTEKGCIDSVDVNIEEIVLELSTTGIAPICANEDAVASGAAFVTATGNDPTAYLYEWNDPSNQTTDTASVLAPGTYIVTVTDITAQCAKTDTVRITAPPVLKTTIVSTEEVRCSEENDGSVVFNIEGGVPDYSIDWGDGFVRTAQDRNDLAAGDYTLTITDDVGCTTPLTFTIDGPDSIKLAFMTTTVNCDSPTASATVMATGGSGNFSYQWNDLNQQTTPTAGGLISETFQVIVTDTETSCSTSGEVSILSEIPFELRIATTPSVCMGEATGSATVEVTGGSGNYKYLWDDENAQTTSKATSLAPGNYMLLVIDEDQGCEESVSVVIEDVSAEMDVSFITQNTSCNGTDDGSTEAMVEGSSGYEYEWSNGASTRAVDNLGVGVYFLTVTDQDGCKVVDTVQIIQPDALSGSVTQLDIACKGAQNGSITIDALGGSGTYEYSIDGNRFTSENIFTDLRANAYFVSVRDDRGCKLDFETINIEEPNAIEISVQGQSIISSGNPVSLKPEVINGQGVLAYSWTSDKEPTSLSCTTCPSPDIMPLTAQAYLVTVTDEKGCEATTAFNVLVRKEKSSVFVPTGFSPNADGHNDVLMIYGKESTRIIHFRIFDRWGELVFERDNFITNDIELGWDGSYQGQPLNPSVFTWLAEVEYADGIREVVKGHTTLVR